MKMEKSLTFFPFCRFQKIIMLYNLYFLSFMNLEKRTYKMSGTVCSALLEIRNVYISGSFPRMKVQMFLDLFGIFTDKCFLALLGSLHSCIEPKSLLAAHAVILPTHHL